MNDKITNFFESTDFFALDKHTLPVAWTTLLADCDADAVRLSGMNGLAQLVAKSHYALKTRALKTPAKRTIYQLAKSCAAAKSDIARRPVNGFCITDDRRIVSTDGRRLLVMSYAGKLQPGKYNTCDCAPLCKMTEAEYAAMTQKNDAGKPIHTDVFPGVRFPENAVLDGKTWIEQEEGEYPKWDHVIPKSFKFSEPVSPYAIAALDTVIHLYKIIDDALNDFVNWELGETTLTLDPNYLRDAIAALSHFCNPDEIIVQYNDNVSPIALRTPDQSAFCVIAPKQPMENFPGMNISRMQAPPESMPAKKTAVKSKPAPMALPESQPATPVPAKNSDSAACVALFGGLNKKAIRNLMFVQQFSFNGATTVESRLDFVNRLAKSGNLSLATWSDSNGKTHYLINGNFAGKTAYDYATSQAAAGIKAAM